MNETGLNSNIPRQALQPRLTEAAHFGPEEEAVVDEVLRAQVQALEREPELEPELEPEPEPPDWACSRLVLMKSGPPRCILPPLRRFLGG